MKVQKAGNYYQKLTEAAELTVEDDHFDMLLSIGFNPASSLQWALDVHF